MYKRQSVTTPVNIGTHKDYNLVGNPFTAYYNTKDILDDNKDTLVEQTLWLREGNKYIAINNTNSKMLLPSEGFFVKSSITDGELYFDKDKQNHNNTTSLFYAKSDGEEPIKKVILNLSNKNNNEVSTTIYFNNNTSLGFDNGWDSSVFNGLDDETSLYTTLAIGNDNRHLAIQSLPDDTSVSIPISISAKAGEEITLSANTEMLESLYLTDTVLHKTVNLIDENYTLTLEQDINNAKRFHLQQHTPKTNRNLATNIKPKLFKSGNREIRVTGISGAIEIDVIDLSGKSIHHSTIESNGDTRLTIPKIPTGIYIIQVRNKETMLSTKVSF